MALPFAAPRGRGRSLHTVSRKGRSHLLVGVKKKNGQRALPDALVCGSAVRSPGDQTWNSSSGGVAGDLKQSVCTIPQESLLARCIQAKTDTEPIFLSVLHFSGDATEAR